VGRDREPRLKTATDSVSDSRLRSTAALGLVVGAVFGIAGSFAPSASLRGLAWGIDGTALTVATALLTVHYFRRGEDFAAAGFLIFLAGEALIVSGSAMDLEASVPTFGAGAALWAAALLIVGASGAMPRSLSAIGYLASILLAVVAVRIFYGEPLTPLSEPLPFFAYPPLAATLVGWAWVVSRRVETRSGHSQSSAR
jgi:hypothetical protein